MRFKSVSFCSLLSILFSPKIDQRAAKKVHDFILSYYFTLRVHYIQIKLNLKKTILHSKHFGS